MTIRGRHHRERRRSRPPSTRGRHHRRRRPHRARCLDRPAPLGVPAPDGGRRSIERGTASDSDRPLPDERAEPRPVAADRPPAGHAPVGRPMAVRRKRSGHGDRPPVVRVTIGRVEVRARPSRVHRRPVRPRPAASADRLSLDDYLERRAGHLAMSNHLAVATVTATLKRTLDEALAAGYPGERPERDRIDRRGPRTRPTATGARRGINIYLYQVMPNAALRNEELPTRRADGSLARRPQAALDLYYLLTFYGDENEQEPQRLLGTAVSTLNARPILSRDAIRDAIDQAIDDDPATYLQFSDLAGPGRPREVLARRRSTSRSCPSCGRCSSRRRTCCRSPTRRRSCSSRATVTPSDGPAGARPEPVRARRFRSPFIDRVRRRTASRSRSRRGPRSSSRGRASSRPAAGPRRQASTVTPRRAR